jgi:transglutaminase-like putative cysteine protease
MKAPALLLSATLIFWGWQTGLWIFAVPMAAILAGYRLIGWRWDFSDDDFRRMTNLCLMILICLFVYLLITNRSIHLIYYLLQLLPLAFFPLLFAQTYSVKESIDINKLFLPLNKANTGEYKSLIVNLSYPYFAICILSAGAANSRSISFYIGMFLLISTALWLKRSPRFSVTLWLCLILFAGSIGFVGQMGVYQLQQQLEARVVEWLSNANSIGQATDSSNKRTSIGDIGVLKQSNQIVFRVATNTPILLKEATYDKYKFGVWVTSNPNFTPIQPDGNGKTWRLGNKPANSSKLTISANLNQGKGLIRLADGTFEVDELPVSRLEKNKYGTIKVAGKNNAIAYQLKFNNSLSLDSPPTADDLQISKREIPAINQIISQLDIKDKSPQAVLQRVDSFFQKNFRYSLKLTGKNNQSTPLSTFLLQTRSGHCEYFATATTLLLRAAGIPARYVVGYSVHEFSSLENQYIVRSRHAHAWTMAYINGKWQAFDTTPADWTSIENAGVFQLSFISDLWSFFSFKLSGWLRSDLVSHLIKYWWLLILPLILLRLGKFNFKNRVRRLATKHLLKKTVAKPEVNKRDEEFYLIETRLKELGLNRYPSESLKNWINRLKEELPNIDELELIVELHYRDRYDPQGIKDTEKASLKSAVQAWLEKLQTHFNRS